MKKLLAIALVCLGFAGKAQICAGSSATLTPPATTLTSPSYTLNPGNFAPNQNGQFVISPTVTTSYTVITQGTGTAGVVTQTSALTVTVYPQPVFTPTLVQPSCTSTNNAFNLGLTFYPAGSPAPTYTIIWAAIPPVTTPNIPPQITSPQQFTASGGIPPGVYGASVTSQGGCGTAVFFTMNPQPSPATFSLVPNNTTFSITCYQPTVDIGTNNPNNTYTWSATSFTPVNSTSISVTSANAGTMSIAATNTVSGCTATKTITIGVNTVVPVSAMTPTFQNITCSVGSVANVTLTATSPTVNFEHSIVPPQGGVWYSNNTPDFYYPGGGTGTYTYVLTNLANGCKTQKTFTITGSNTFPTFSLISTPLNFTLGCNAKATITLSILNAASSPTPGAPLSYTFLAPGSSTALPSGTLSGISSRSINIPGTWTVVTKDNSNQCETRVPVSITTNTLGPKIDTVIVPQYVLDCNTKTMVMEAKSEAPSISYNWAYGPNNLAAAKITVNTNTASPTTTVINIYTLTVTDLNNTCVSVRNYTILQNLFPPKPGVTAGGTGSLSCVNQTVMLTNQSSTGIPANLPPFTTNLPIQGYLWSGPSPQPTVQISSTYVASTPGFYTLTVKDLNNGCTATTTTLNIGDNKTFPIINNPTAPPTASIDCGSAGATLTPIYNSIINASYKWDLPQTVPGSILTNSNCLAPVPGIYTVTVTNDPNNIGCVATATMEAVKGFLTGKIDPDVTTGFAPLTVNFVNNSFSANNSTSSITTVWSFGNGTSTITPSASITAFTTYSTAGTYTVMAYVTKNPCQDTVYKVINVSLPSKLVIPNVFTPNGDNVNDFFFLKATSLTDISVVIFNRWGQKVYELTTSVGNISWDGKDQYGKEVAEGVYYYVIKAKGKDGASYDESGNVTLLR